MPCEVCDPGPGRQVPAPVRRRPYRRWMTVVRSRVQMPRMNPIMERWERTCRRELLDRTLLWNQRHLLQALREFEIFYNAHRPHQGIANARPLAPLPEPITDPDRLARLNIHRRDRLGGVLHEYEHAA
jgi:putative transposase